MRNHFFKILYTIFFLIALGVITPVIADISDFDDFKPEQKPKDLEVEALEKLLKTLENKSERNDLVLQLKTLVAAKKKQQEESTTLALSKVSETIHSTSGKIIDFLNESEKFFTKFILTLNDSHLRSQLILTFKNTILILALGFLISKSIRYLSYYIYDRFREQKFKIQLSQRQNNVMQRLISSLSIIIMSLTMFIMANLIQFDGSLKQITYISIIALIIYEFSLFLYDSLLSPKRKELRLIPLQDTTAVLTYRYLRIVTFLIVIGLCLSELALFFQVPTIIYTVIIKSMLIMACIKSLWFIYVMRHRVSSWLVRQDHTSHSNGQIAETVSKTWHVWASLYVCMFSLSIYFQRTNNVRMVALLFLGNAVLIGVAYVLVLKVPKFMQSFMNRVINHLPHIAPRKGFYTILLSILISSVIIFTLIYLSLELWDLEIFDFFSETDSIPTALINFLLIVALGIFIWEINEYIIDRFFNRTHKHQKGAIKKQRLLTIKPLVQNITRFILFTLMTLVLFAELKLDLTPLLAGMGVIGIAFSFGSQSLVKDLITGIFILVEDTINVGDIVQIDNQNGNVEAISLRTVKLRDSEGSLHTIPFSSITRITNMSKNYSYYLLQISLSYFENMDHAFDVMREVDKDLRTDTKYNSLILEPLEIAGVDKFTETGVIIQARIKTLPDKSRWIVGREFNRRLKDAFDRNNIEFAYEYRGYEMLSSKASANKSKA